MHNAPINVTPEIMRNTQYAEEYIAHVALVRELLDQASLSTHANLLVRSNNQLLQSLGGLLKGASNCELTTEPIPVRSMVRVVWTKPDAELVRQTTALMGSADNISINMPSVFLPCQCKGSLYMSCCMCVQEPPLWCFCRAAQKLHS